MAIVNNAAPGSQINLICMIYRVLSRNPFKYTRDELINLCSPKTLFRKPGHETRFSRNFDYWAKDELQLWYKNDSGCYGLVNESGGLASIDSVAQRVREVFFEKLDDDFLNPDNKEIAQLYRTLALINILPDFAPLGKQFLSKITLEATINNLFDKYQLNDSERPTFLEYCHFLGFLELESSKGKVLEYTVDGTAAINDCLSDLNWNNNQLTIEEFIEQLSIRIPVFQGGYYYNEIQNYLLEKGLLSIESKSINHALSLSIFRLNSIGLLKIISDSDDQNAMKLYSPSGVRSISRVEYRGVLLNA